MAGFDQRAYSNAYKREKMLEAKARFSYASGGAQALLAACEKSGTNKSAYARIAILEKMAKDGFFPSDYAPVKEVMPENQYIPERDDPAYAGLLHDQEDSVPMPEVPEMEE